jgi:hypothetical protein
VECLFRNGGVADGFDCSPVILDAVKTLLFVRLRVA